VHRSVQLRLDRTNVDVEHGRNLLKLHFGIKTEAENLSLPRWQLSFMGHERGDSLFLHRSAFRPGGVVRHPIEEVMAIRVSQVEKAARRSKSPILVYALTRLS
jgi:hypothetical protein